MYPLSPPMLRAIFRKRSTALRSAPSKTSNPAGRSITRRSAEASASSRPARDLFRAGRELADAPALRRGIDLPAGLDVFEGAERRAVDRFLKIARSMGGDKGYIAEHRKAWWSIGLRPPAPILTTYMARRTPAFVLNRAEARHINIAHGIYPRETL